MGLLDSILGNVMGGTSAQSRSGSMSPMVKTLLMLLAARALQQHRSGSQTSGGLEGMLGGGSGGLGGMLGGGSGGLGGMLGGGSGAGGLGGLLGGLLGGGALGGLLDQFRQSGYGQQVDSWVGTGPNHALDPQSLSQALGPDTVDELEQHTGMPRDQLLSELSQELPQAVDQFTPDGRLPTEEEASSQWV
jgi:uncharacterized protein YidB (DUF937 family)